MISTALAISALVIGFSGSLHCMGMCGPLVIAMPFNALTGWKKGIAITSYFFAKAAAYGLLGFISGTIGKSIYWMNWQQMLSVIAGLLLLLFALVPHLFNRLKLNYPFQQTFSRLFSHIGNQPRISYFAGLGFLNGLLPCGLIYTTLAIAVVSGTPSAGFLFMLLFGIGTAPLLIITVIFSQQLKFRYKSIFKKLAFYISIFIGVLLIIRGLGLGIPYISPAELSLQHDIIRCH